jgi:pimeloyl-ACP methyl ester carboxylesterase
MAARRRILPSTVRPASLAAAAGAGPDYGAGDRPDWRAIAWRSHQRAITVEGRRVHLVDIGSGDAAPVLFVHGLGGRWQNWLETIPRIAQSRRAVAFDLPGFGHSQMPVSPISIAGYAGVIERVCDLLELEEVVAVGNSLGGAIVARAALRYPALVQRLVLVSAAALSPHAFNPALGAAVMGAIARTSVGSPAGMRAIIRRRRARHLAFAALLRHPTLIAADTLAELVAGRGSAALAAASRAMLDSVSPEELGTIAQPALVVHGREDALVPLADAQWLHEQIPGARLEVIDDTGHLPMIERPRRFNELLLDFAAS